ncbi:hypothetical protein KGM_203446 [Danaus plexippus plexippus]|uniref:Uncharacterized protein n=1 Tax=Danaus plexippus plexippus TaxID=278856 RepID=A0A212F6Y3_DANPL|nr:hypothetical protein KGM_203446 [Danaus plexippus plexippus]
MEAGFIPVSAPGGGGTVPPPAVVAPPANVIRAPGLKRGKMEEAISDRLLRRRPTRDCQSVSLRAWLASDVPRSV